MKLDTQGPSSSLIKIWYDKRLQKRLFTSILQNSYFEKLLSVIRMWWRPVMRWLRPVRVSRKWGCPFSMLNCKSRKKVMQPFFSIKIFKIHKKVMRSFLALITVKVVRKWRSPFFRIKNFKSCQVVMEFFQRQFFLSFRSFKSREKVTESFFSNHASLSFQSLEQYFLCQFPLNFFDFFLWLNISFTIHFISMKKDAEHISVNIVRATFLLHQ